MLRHPILKVFDPIDRLRSSFSILRWRGFANLWSGQLMSTLGDWALVLALPLFVFDRTGSPLQTGATFGAGLLPRVLFSLIGGSTTDRFGRYKALMIGADLSRAAILLVLLINEAQPPVGLVLSIVFIESAISQFSLPAWAVSLRLIVSDRSLISANSLNSVGENAARVLGPVIGGTAYSLGGLGGVVLFDVATYLVSAAFISALRLPQPSEANERRRTPPRNTWRGFGQLLRRQSLRRLLVLNALVVFAEGVITAALIPFVREDLGGEAAAIGLMFTARGFGGLVGGGLVGTVSGRARPSVLVTSGLITASCILAGLVILHSVEGAVLMSGLVGISAVAISVGFQTFLQRSVPTSHVGRAFSLFQTAGSTLSILALSLGGRLSELIGTSRALLFAASVQAVAGLVAVGTLPGVEPRVAEGPRGPGSRDAIDTNGERAGAE